MRPLGQTRPLLAYGVPAAAGLAVGGALTAQGEDPGTAALGGAAAALGARGGLGAARLAGKHSPELIAKLQERAAVPLGNVIGNIGLQVPAESKYRSGVIGKAADIVAGLHDAKIGEAGQKRFKQGVAALAVPASAAAAGLGGMALGAIPGAMGVPGFGQGGAIDPESPGSSNTASAKYGVTPYASTQYM